MKNWIVSTLIGSLTLSAAFAAPKSTQATTGTTLLEQTSQAFTQIADKAMPATVFIKAEVPQSPQQQYINPFDLFGDDFSRRFFGQQPMMPQTPQPQVSGGSGFLISSDGYIVTNNHVIQDAATITVTINDGSEYKATVKGADPRTDLAVLKIEKKDLPYLSFGDSDVLKVGEWVVAIGNPFGIGTTLTKGVVSAKGRQDLGIASYEDFIQTDAAINPGNSGGPLLNLHGEVIGVNTAIFTKSGGYMGIGLAIPSKMAENVIDQIIDNGSVKRAYLGVMLQPVDKELSNAFQLDSQEGVLISDVVKDSPASKAGLQPGDIIISYNDQPVKTVTKFRNEISLMNPGATIKLKILRNNKKMDFSIILASQESEMISAELIQKLGIEIENLNPELSARLGYRNETQGIVITKIKPGSPVALAGIQPGSLITGIIIDGQKSIHNTSEFEEAMKDVGDKKHLILIIRNHNFQRYYTIKLP